MKPINYFLGMLFLFVGLSTQAQVSQTVNFSVNNVTTGQTNGSDWVKLKNATPLYGDEYVGDPQLPVVSVKLALPQGQKASSVTISTNQQTPLAGDFDLMAVQELEPLGTANKDGKCINSPNGRGKKSSSPFPDNPLLKFTNHQYREYSYVSVRFIPFSYNAQTGQLDLLTQLTVSVSTTTGSPTLTSLRPKTHFDQRARQNLKKTVTNPQQFAQFYTVAPPVAPFTNGNEPGSIFDASDLPSEYGSAVPYIIITNNELSDKFQQFADWKTRKGTPAKVVTVAAITNAYPGGDVPEKIWHFIQDAHALKKQENQFFFFS